MEVIDFISSDKGYKHSVRKASTSYKISPEVSEEERTERLAKAEAALSDWVAFSQEWSKKPSRREIGEGPTKNGSGSTASF